MKDHELLISHLEPPNVFQRLSKTARKRIEYGLLMLMMMLVALEVWVVRKNVLLTAFADHPPIQFIGEMSPEKEAYTSGEIIRFTYRRITKFSKEESPLLVLSLDSFENKETGEIYSGATMGRVIDQPGDVTRVAIRRLPPDMSPGVYYFEGWMQAQTAKRTLPVAYKSRPFVVQ